MKPSDFGKMTRPLRRRLGALFMRGTVLDVEAGGSRVRVKVGLRAGEVADFLELFEPFGFTSPPLPDRDGVITLAIGGHGSNRIAFNAGGRYHRPTDLAPGESCVYNQHGDRVTIRNDRSIVVDADERVIVNTRTAQVNASEQATINSQTITLNATFTHVTNALQVDGNLGCLGLVRDARGTMQSMRNTFNYHTHRGDSDGYTDQPNSKMV